MTRHATIRIRVLIRRLARARNDPDAQVVGAAFLSRGAVATAVGAVGGAAGNGNVVIGHIEVGLGFDDCFICMYVGWRVPRKSARVLKVREGCFLTEAGNAEFHAIGTFPGRIGTAIAPDIAIVTAFAKTIRCAGIPWRATHAVFAIGIAWFVNDAYAGLVAYVLVRAIGEVAASCDLGRKEKRRGKN